MAKYDSNKWKEINPEWSHKGYLCDTYLAHPDYPHQTCTNVATHFFKYYTSVGMRELILCDKHSELRPTRPSGGVFEGESK